MGLSSDLISQFVKVTNDTTKTKKETSTVYGTVTDAGTTTYVQLDGSNTATPVSTTVNVKKGDRVIVMIKNHTATITGNLRDPSASSQVFNNSNADISNRITELGIAIADRVTTGQLNAVKATITDEMVAKDVVVQDKLTASIAEVERQLTAANVTITNKVVAAEAQITELNVNKLGVEDAKAIYATIANLNAANAEINSLRSTYGEFENAVVKDFTAVRASITDLDTKKLDAETAAITYATIDFSNIGKAAIETLFSKSGMIGDLVVGDGTITGKLVGVTISGDLIEGNTVKAEKLVVKGSDGLYYKLNIEAGATTSAEVSESDLQNGLHGTSIIAKTITAEKISVNDLVAFGATIGGFHISDTSLYSGVKESVDNTTQGVYLDSSGQINIGDGDNFIKYFRDADGNYKLEISSVNGLEMSVSDVKATVETAEERIYATESLIQQLSDSISMLVTDGNGTSLMTQTEDGWTFSTSDIQHSVNNISESLSSLITEVGDANHAVDILQQAVDDLGVIAEYVKIGTYENEPCIELGEGDSDFKLRITNTRMMFMEGSAVLAYFNNQSLHIKKAVVEEELQQGGFVWKARSNGNLGLVWKGATS